MRLLNALLRKETEPAPMETEPSSAENHTEQVDPAGGSTEQDAARDVMSEKLARLERIMALYESAQTEIEAAEYALDRAIAECASACVQKSAEQLRMARQVLLHVEDRIAPD